MKCVDPYVNGGDVYPCGKCLPCRFRSRRIWFHRVLLEASQHDCNSVVTLTYDEASLPKDGELDPKVLRDWLKRYRKRLARETGRRVRFIAVGEYGETSSRPHYHVVLFGAPACLNGRVGILWCQDCGCSSCRRITETWRFGAASVDSLSRASSAYVAGYVTRKVLASSTGTKQPPFQRMSNRPGIGANAMHDVASTVLQYGLPLPMALQQGGKPMVLGRYLRKKLSEAVDQEVPRFEPTDAMRAVQNFAWTNSRSIRGVYAEIFAVLASQLRQAEALKEKRL